MKNSKPPSFLLRFRSFHWVTAESSLLLSCGFEFWVAAMVFSCPFCLISVVASPFELRSWNPKPPCFVLSTLLVLELAFRRKDLWFSVVKICGWVQCCISLVYPSNSVESSSLVQVLGLVVCLFTESTRWVCASKFESRVSRSLGFILLLSQFRVVRVVSPVLLIELLVA